MWIEIVNKLFSWWNSIVQQKENGIKQVYLVGSNGNRRIITVDELRKPYDHVEMEFTYNNKTYVHILPVFHHIHDTSPVILSAILNDHIDITDHVAMYLINDLSYVKVKHIIPSEYQSTFEKLEILDEDCNSLIYRKLDSRLEFLEPYKEYRERSNSH